MIFFDYKILMLIFNYFIYIYTYPNPFYSKYGLLESGNSNFLPVSLLKTYLNASNF